jgi:hypothetical protein
VERHDIKALRAAYFFHNMPGIKETYPIGSIRRPQLVVRHHQDRGAARL